MKITEVKVCRENEGLIGAVLEKSYSLGVFLQYTDEGPVVSHQRKNGEVRFEQKVEEGKLYMHVGMYKRIEEVPPIDEDPNYMRRYDRLRGKAHVSFIYWVESGEDWINNKTMISDEAVACPETIKWFGVKVFYKHMSGCPRSSGRKGDPTIVPHDIYLINKQWYQSLTTYEQFAEEFGKMERSAWVDLTKRIRMPLITAEVKIMQENVGTIGEAPLEGHQVLKYLKAGPTITFYRANGKKKRSQLVEEGELYLINVEEAIKVPPLLEDPDFVRRVIRRRGALHGLYSMTKYLKMIPGEELNHAGGFVFENNEIIKCPKKLEKITMRSDDYHCKVCLVNETWLSSLESFEEFHSEVLLKKHNKKRFLKVRRVEL